MPVIVVGSDNYPPFNYMSTDGTPTGIDVEPVSYTHLVRTAFVYQINKYLKEKNLYKKGESAISFQDVQDCLVYVSSSFSDVYKRQG